MNASVRGSLQDIRRRFLPHIDISQRFLYRVMSVPHHRSGSVNTHHSFTPKTAHKFDVIPTNSRYATTASAMMRNPYLDMPRTACGMDGYGSANGGEADDYPMFTGAPRTASSMYNAREPSMMTAASMYDAREPSMMTAASMYDMHEARTAASMYDMHEARTAASMYDMHEARTAASMYDMHEARTAASMYDMHEARTAASMYDDAVMRAARTAASMYDEPDIRAFSNPYARSSISTTSKSFSPSMPYSVTKSSFPQPLFPQASTASAFGEYWE